MNSVPGIVVTEVEARVAADAWRAAGLRVVFTNGAFDVLHVGHARMLAAAAALGDVLVVGINDDESVRSSRGRSRPFLPAAERAELVAAIAGVDRVLVFADRTADRLLEVLRPHVHAKGREYAEATHPEAETNRRLGIEMAFVGDTKSHAASDLLDRKRVPSPIEDRVVAFDVLRGSGLVLRSRRELLVREGLTDLEALVDLQRGTEVLRHATRVVRRVEVSGDVLFTKVECPARRGATALEEFGHHVALRTAGFRAPEPWLALEGPLEGGRKARALVTREARGVPLDQFLERHYRDARPRERAAWARGIGAALRALHTARFLHPDLMAYHLIVDGSPAGGAASIVFLDLARLHRATSRVTPSAAAPGLAALALSLRPVCPRRFRLAILRAYLGGSLAEGRRFARAIERRIRRVEGRGTFRRYAAPS